MEVSALRLNLLRGMYLLIALGLGVTIWPEIILPLGSRADSHSVISALLGALGLMSLIGLRYPLKMLPLLMFEFLWKLIWVLAFAVRMSLDTGLDSYAKDTLFACAIGLILVPLVLPWRYVLNQYFNTKGEPWTDKKAMTEPNNQ